MKTFRTLGILLISIFAISFISCSDDDEEDDDYPYDHIKGGGTFLRANDLRFYYIDGDGNDLLDPQDLSSLPVSYNNNEKLPEAIKVPDDLKNGGYNGNHNGVYLDSELGLHYMMSSAYGDMEKSTYTFYIGYKDEFDKMDVTYRYTDKNVIGGKYHAKIISWKFNGVHVYTDDDGGDKKVFVKKANGQTTTSFKR